MVQNQNTVVQNNTNIQVAFETNKVLEAKVIGSEPDKDIAVLKVTNPSVQLERNRQAQLSSRDNKRNQAVEYSPTFKPLALGTSHNLLVGQKVFAIGNPFGLDHTLTGGIVSGLGREVKSVGGRNIRDVIQTDAAINPGNSGGPLLDSKGRLIGVNAMIYSPSGAFAGVGFAIPVDTVRRIVNQIVRYGRVVRPGLGITLLPDSTTQQLLGTNASGVIVFDVMPNTGADHVGLKGVQKDNYGRIVIGDIISRIGGERIGGVEDLVSAIEQFSVGDQVPLTIQRGSEFININVPLTGELNQRAPQLP